MATIYEYYEKDFSSNLKLHVKVQFKNEDIPAKILYDIAGYNSFISCYVSQKNRPFNFFLELIQFLQFGRTIVEFDNKVTLPSAKEFPGTLRVENKEDFKVFAQYFGDTEWISILDIQSSKRIFIYSETNLEKYQISILKAKAKHLDIELQFRDEAHNTERDKHEKPLAFISHDSRDKKKIVQNIAIGLQKLHCPVWYDEFTLRIGDNLREKIEKGLKECKKCVLILSPNFISNNGWTKKEFDSIFTREILEEQKLVLPIWYNVTKQEVYNYSPSLLNVVGADWNKLGEDQVCMQLYRAIHT